MAGHFFLKKSVVRTGCVVCIRFESQADGKLYIGSTSNLKRRVYQHNSGKVDSTRQRLPFELQAYIAVQSEEIARHLEKYLMTGSGHAILYKRILQPSKL